MNVISNCYSREYLTHVIPYMHPAAGGPPVVVDRLCRQLVARGWNTRVVTTDTLARQLDRSWVDVYADAYPIDVHVSRGPGGFGYSPALWAAIDGVVAASRLVHVHAVWSHPGWAAIRACRRQRVPYLVMPHGMLDPHSLRRKWFKKQLYGRLVEWPNLRHAAAMVYTHREEQRLAESAVRGLPPGYVVPLGTDLPPDVPREALAEEFLSGHPELRARRLVIFLSRLHPKKGLDLLIPAFAAVAKAREDARLVLVGQGERSYVAKLRRWAGQYGVADRLTFAGPLAGRAKWSALAAGTVLALPSYQENFGLVVVEALAIGLPVVITRRVNIWSDVVGAGAGVACELNPGSVADALTRFLSDQGFAGEAGLRGRRLAGREFTWTRHSQLMEEVYRGIVPGPGTARCGPCPSPAAS